MKREEMTRIVHSELKHIPRGLRGSTQNILRLYYNAMRRHDLSINPKTTAKESLEKILEHLRKDYPDYPLVMMQNFSWCISNYFSASRTMNVP